MAVAGAAGCATLRAPFLPPVPVEAAFIESDAVAWWGSTSSSEAWRLDVATRSGNALAPVDGPAGCLSRDGGDGTAGSPTDRCTSLPALRGLNGVAVIGRHLYLSGRAASGGRLLVLGIDVAVDGSIVIPSPQPCAGVDARADCALLSPATRGPLIVAPPEGHDLLLLGLGAIHRLARSPDGLLAEVPGAAGCFGGTAPPCAEAAPGGVAAGVRSIVIFDGGRRAIAFAGEALLNLRRDPATGVLSREPGAYFCVARHLSCGLSAADFGTLSVAADGSRALVGDRLYLPQQAPTCGAATAIGELETALDACSDLNGDPIRLAVVGRPAHGSARPISVRGDHQLQYTSVPGFTGIDPVVVDVTDGGQTRRTTIPVTVLPAPRVRVTSLTGATRVGRNRYWAVYPGNVRVVVRVTGAPRGTAVQGLRSGAAFQRPTFRDRPPRYIVDSQSGVRTAEIVARLALVRAPRRTGTVLEVAPRFEFDSTYRIVDGVLVLGGTMTPKEAIRAGTLVLERRVGSRFRRIGRVAVDRRGRLAVRAPAPGRYRVLFLPRRGGHWAFVFWRLNLLAATVAPRAGAAAPSVGPVAHGPVGPAAIE